MKKALMRKTRSADPSVPERINPKPGRSMRLMMQRVSPWCAFSDKLADFRVILFHPAR
jgi:hypothetical protein